MVVSHTDTPQRGTDENEPVPGVPKTQVGKLLLPGAVGMKTTQPNDNSVQPLGEGRQWRETVYTGAETIDRV